MKLIALSGKAGAGKTTFASHALNIYPGQKIALADAVKEEAGMFLHSCCVSFEMRHLFGTMADKAETFVVELGNWLAADYRPRRVLNPHVKLTPEGDVSMTYRQLLQLWGTEYRRAEDPDYWVSRAKEKISRAPGRVFVDDIRFESEARMVQELGGVLVRIERPGIELLDHASEVALDDFREWDYIIGNCGSLEHFHGQIEGVMEAVR